MTRYSCGISRSDKLNVMRDNFEPALVFQTEGEFDEGPTVYLRESQVRHLRDKLSKWLEVRDGIRRSEILVDDVQES